MRFIKIASVAILLVLSFFGLAMASPVARATEAEIAAIITSLRSTISPNLANINTIAQQNPSTFSDAAGDIITISNAFNAAVAQLAALNSPYSGAGDSIPTLASNLLIEMLTVINQVGSSTSLILNNLPSLDVSLSNFLRVLTSSNVNFLIIIQNRLISVVPIIFSLRLNLTARTLGY